VKHSFNVFRAVIEKAISADGVESFEINADALSVLLLRIKPLNDTGTLANYQRYRAACAALNNVQLTWNGVSVLNMRGEDIASMNWLRWGVEPEQANPDNVDNERRSVVLPIYLGKAPFDPKSCLPPVQRGQLTLTCDFDIADTGYDGLRFAVDAVELPRAKPTEYERRVQVVQTTPATGINNLELVPGNPCRGIFLFGTTGFAGAAPAPSFDQVSVLLDNDEMGFTNVENDLSIAWPALFGRHPYMGEHKHTVNAAGAGVEETTSVFDVAEDHTLARYLDFDVTRDDEHTLDTSKARRFNLRYEADTADAVRAVQMEVIKV
jgi:hypothetical protein